MLDALPMSSKRVDERRHLTFGGVFLKDKPDSFIEWAIEHFNDKDKEVMIEERKYRINHKIWHKEEYNPNKLEREHEINIKLFLREKGVTKRILERHPNPSDVALLVDIQQSDAYQYFTPEEIVKFNCIRARVAAYKAIAEHEFAVLEKFLLNADRVKSRTQIKDKRKNKHARWQEHENNRKKLKHKYKLKTKA
jgi:hypothetical protein